MVPDIVYHVLLICRMVGERNPAAFLFNQLVKDVNELSQYLGRSVDDTIVIMHEIVNRMRTLKVSGKVFATHVLVEKCSFLFRIQFILSQKQELYNVTVTVIINK